MTAILRGLFRWSLEITGVSIIWYNYQPYDRQQKLLGIYNFARNSIRLTRCLYGLQQDFKAYHQNVKEKGALQVFRQATASKLKGLCQDNAGVYARIAEIISAERDIVPEEYASEFKQLLERTPEEVPYADIKTALTSIFQKDTKELFDGFQTKPFNVGLFTQSHKAVLLENYREAVVKVLLPSLKVQADHDLWLINKVKDYAIDYLKKHKVEEQSYQFFTDILREAEESVRSEINLEQELANADRNK
jgi:predicted unusual protein kinase regulating ubiquinone biosynthesis (AarF/ABC1/UbiB family)